MSPPYRGVHAVKKKTKTVYYFRPFRGTKKSARYRHFEKNLGTDPNLAAFEAAKLWQEIEKGKRARHKNHTDVSELRHAIMNKLGSARHRAKSKNLPYDIDVDYVMHLMEKSKYCCEVSGIPFDVTIRSASNKAPFSPSIDRIVPSLGYIKGNVRVVCFMVNVAILDWGVRTLYTVLSSMVKKHSTTGKFVPPAEILYPQEGGLTVVVKPNEHNHALRLEGR